MAIVQNRVEIVKREDQGWQKIAFVALHGASKRTRILHCNCTRVGTRICIHVPSVRQHAFVFVNFPF